MAKKTTVNNAPEVKPDPYIDKTERKTVATAPRKAILDDDNYSMRPFEYKEGLSILDITEQSKSHKERLQTNIADERRKAKTAGWINLLSAIGTMAGGGYTAARHKPLPIYTDAQNRMTAYQDELDKTDLYYKELARKARAQDYNDQYERHRDSEKMRLDMLMRGNQFNRKLQNDVESDNYKAGLQEVTTRTPSQLEIERVKAQTNTSYRNAATAERNSQLSEQRLEASLNGADTKQEKLFLQWKPITGYAKPINLTKSGALAVINEVRSEYSKVKNKPNSELTPEQIAIKEDYANMMTELNSANAESSDNIIRDMAYRYVNMNPEKYRTLDISRQSATVADMLTEDEEQSVISDMTGRSVEGAATFKPTMLR